MAYFRKWFLSGISFSFLSLPLATYAEANITVATPAVVPTTSPAPVQVTSVSDHTEEGSDILSIQIPAITAPVISKQTPSVISLTATDSPSSANVIPVETFNPVPLYQPETTLAPLYETETHYTLPIDFTPGMVPLSDGYVTDYEYQDPTIHVKIERGREQDCTFWICEVRIADASQLRTASADGFDSNMTMPGTAIAKRVNAVVAIDGDYFCYTGRGYIMRQGRLYLDRTTGGRDVLMIDEDGDFHIVRKANRNECKDTINGKKVINAFFFGPVLVENGVLGNEFRYTDMAYDLFSQRMAIAQIGKLHYKIICCESPKRGSTGMTLKQFAQFCQEKGATTAYNLDGGDSTMLIFKNQKLNDIDNPHTRPIADIIYFASAYRQE